MKLIILTALLLACSVFSAMGSDSFSENYRSSASETSVKTTKDDYKMVERVSAFYKDNGKICSFRTSIVLAGKEYYIMNDPNGIIGSIIYKNPEYGTRYDWTSRYKYYFLSGGIKCYFNSKKLR